MSPILGILASSRLAAVGDYESIQTVTLGSSQTTITFSGIPNTYTHLQIRGIVACTVAGTDANGVTISLNGDTTNTNYYYHLLYGTGSAATAYASNTYAGLVTTGISPKTSQTNMFGALVCDILDYKNTNKYKTMRALNGVDLNNSSGSVALSSGLWMNTAAVTSVTLNITYLGDIAAKSSFALYGIR